MIEKLKNEIEIKIGRKISYQKDCIYLSANILEQSKAYISPATLRRVFGFLATNSNPSRVTLDILSRFVAYKDWDDFIQNNTNNKTTSSSNLIECWDLVAKNASIISSNSIEQIRIKSGIEFDCTVKRAFIKDRLKTFFASQYSAVAFIAPGGYGKSTMLAHWYLNRIKKKKHTGDIILFMSAQLLDQFAPTEVFIETWLLRLLGLKPDSAFFTEILHGKNNVQGQFIIIIDALDEITSQGSKQEKIYKSLVDLAEKLAKSDKFKLIVTARLSTWKAFSTHIKENSIWGHTDPELFSKEGANIPPLNLEEIQVILDNTLNKDYANRILVHEMHPDLREIISYPYFLQLFISVYTPESKHLLNDQLSILSEFLKKQVYFAHYSDEKIDILNQIITLSKYGQRLVLKDELKSIYPIHLKLSGNYYAAYEDLTSYGIIIEETQVDTFGVYLKYIRIANQQLMSMLIVQNLIRIERGLNSKIFLWVDKNLSDNELKSSILSTLFKLAYKERLTDPIQNFFELSKEALALTFQNPTITITFRTDSLMRNSLLPIYSKNPTARKLFFENNVDLNHIVDSFNLFLKTYLENSSKNDEIVWANTLLCFNSFISADSNHAIAHLEKSNHTNTMELDPLIAGIWFANNIIFETFVGNQNSMGWIEKATKHSALYKDNEAKDDFAEFVVLSLILIGQSHYIPKIIKLSDDFSKPNHRSAMRFLFTKFYRFEHEKKVITNEENSIIEQIYCVLNPLRSYFGIIVGETLRSSYFLSSNNLEESNVCFRNAIELSGIAGYKLVEASLMKNLSMLLNQLGENEKANNCIDYVDSIWKRSGFKHELP